MMALALGSSLCGYLEWVSICLYKMVKVLKQTSTDGCEDERISTNESVFGCLAQKVSSVIVSCYFVELTSEE